MRGSSSGSRRSRRRAASSKSATVTCTRRSPTRRLSSAGVPVGDGPPAAQDDDLVGEAVGLLEVLRGEDQRGAVVDQAGDRLPHVGPRRRGPGRWSARRGRRPAGSASGTRRGPAGGACRRCRCRPGGRRRGRSRSARASRRCACSRRAWTAVCRRPISIRFSRPVRRSSSDASWPATAICSRTACGSRTTSRPATSARPVVGESSVVRIRTAVVLPAPLWPSRPSTVPGSTARSRPLRASVAPKRRPRSSVRTAYDIVRRTIVVRCTRCQATKMRRHRSGLAPSRAAAAGASRCSRAQIVKVAVSIADLEGLEAVSMRRLARELRSRRDVALPLLRQPRRAARADGRHGRGRDARAVAAGRVAPGDRRRSRAQSRAAFLAHPWLLPDPAGRPAPRRPNLLRHIEQSAQAVMPLAGRVDPALLNGIVDRGRRLHGRVHHARDRLGGSRSATAASASASPTRTSGICWRAASSRCCRSSSTAASRRRRRTSSGG